MKDWHYFASSVAGWSCAATLGEVLDRQRRKDRRGVYKIPVCNVWRVPGLVTRSYSIDGYRPMVEGTVYLGPYYYKQKDREECEKKVRLQQDPLITRTAADRLGEMLEVGDEQ